MVSGPSPSSKVSVSGSYDAFGVLTFAIHAPSLAAFTVVTSLLHDVVTFTWAPGLAQPQRRTSVCCCNTMLSPTRCDNLTFACADKAARAISARKSLFFIYSMIIVLYVNFGNSSQGILATVDRRQHVEHAVAPAGNEIYIARDKAQR